MTQYAATELPPSDIKLRNRVNATIGALPDDAPCTKSCHTLAAKIGELFSLRVKTGTYGGYFEHSWCVTDHGNVIDVYPVGTVGAYALLVDITVARWLYKAAGEI